MYICVCSGAVFCIYNRLRAVCVHDQDLTFIIEPYFLIQVNKIIISNSLFWSQTTLNDRALLFHQTVIGVETRCPVALGKKESQCL